MRHLRTLPTASDSPPAQPRVERVAAVLVLLSACTLETLPIFCWLLMLAAYDTADPNKAAVPFWWMWVLVFGISWLGVLFTRGTDDNPRRRRANARWLTVAVAVLGSGSLLATFWLSPAVHLFLATGSDTSGPVAVALLVAWLWWRGLSLGRGRLTRERMYRGFILALGGTIAALAGAAAIQGAARALTMSYLSLLLALLLFAGTMGLTLAQARDATYEMQYASRGQQPITTPPVFTRSWLAASLGLSLGLSLLSLLLTTIVSRQSVRVLAIAAGNVMNGLIDAVEFVLTPIFVLIYLALNKPIEWLANLFRGLQPPKPLTLPSAPPSCAATPAATAVATPVSGAPAAAAPCVPPVHTPTTSLIPEEWLTVMRWGTAMLIVVIALFVLARALSRYTEVRRVRAFSEERAMLDAREILGGQLRRFFGAFRRVPPLSEEPEGDDLATDTVRRVYRDTLVAAAATGRARQVAETPREYQHRITSADESQAGAEPPPEVAGALSRLTRAYEQARYGQPDTDVSPPATPDTVNAAEVVRRWLGEKRRE